MRALLLCALVLSAGLGGCLGDDEDAEPEGELATAAAEQAATVPAADASQPTRELVERRIAMDVEVSQGPVVCRLPIYDCFGFWITTEPSSEEHASGQIERIEMTATWEPNTPFTEVIEIWVYMQVPNMFSGGTNQRIVAEATGTSPLNVTVEVPAKAGSPFLLRAEPGPGPTPVLRASVAQHVHVEGTYTVWTEVAP